MSGVKAKPKSFFSPLSLAVTEQSETDKGRLKALLGSAKLESYNLLMTLLTSVFAEFKRTFIILHCALSHRLIFTEKYQHLYYGRVQVISPRGNQKRAHFYISQVNVTEMGFMH